MEQNRICYCEWDLTVACLEEQNNELKGTCKRKMYFFFFIPLLHPAVAAAV